MLTNPKNQANVVAALERGICSVYVVVLNETGKCRGEWDEIYIL